MAAIRIPIQARGIFSAISNKASRVTDSFVIVNAFMASPPKKVLELFSEGTIGKTEIYIYLFMTLIINTKQHFKFQCLRVRTLICLLELPLQNNFDQAVFVRVPIERDCKSLFFA
jgi:hypothetical protein